MHGQSNVEGNDYRIIFDLTRNIPNDPVSDEMNEFLFRLNFPWLRLVRLNFFVRPNTSS